MSKAKLVVSDATPLIALAKIKGLFWLKTLFGEVVIPPAVYHEVVIEGKGRTGSEEVEKATWIKTLAVRDQENVDILLFHLDAGEAEAIVLARSLQADWLLMDEIRGRLIAQQLGLKIIGTVGILLLAKNQGLIEEVRPALDLLMAKRFRLSSKVYDWILEQAGETDA